MSDTTEKLPPFRRMDALVHDLDEPAIRRALRRGDLVAVRRGVLVGRDHIARASTPREEHALRVQVALTGLRGGSNAAACLGSAASLHGIARLGRSPERVRLYRERGGTFRDAELAILVCSLPDHHVMNLDGILTTTAARTTVDLARWVTFRSGVVVADSALRLGCCPSRLAAVLRDCAGWPGIRKARQVVQFADGRAATPLESISRVVMHEFGLPPPEPQVPLPSIDAPVGIVDFYWEEFRVVGEADGLLKYDAELDGGKQERNPLRAEKLRQEALEDLGYHVVRWTWDDIWRRPDRVMNRLRSAFNRALR